MFQYFCSRWSDAGGLPDYGFQWWFNGNNPAQGQSGWSQVQYAGGRFFPSQSVSQYVHVAWNESGAMANISQYLRSGYGTTLGIFGPGGHAITCWGYDVDPQTQAYRGVFVTDSDDAKSSTNPPDQLQYYRVAQSGGRWYLQNYYGSNAWYISEVVGLARRPSGVPLGGAAVAAAGMSGGMPLGGAAGLESKEIIVAALSAAPTGDAPLADEAHATLLSGQAPALRSAALHSLLSQDLQAVRPATSHLVPADFALASFRRSLPAAPRAASDLFGHLADSLDWVPSLQPA